MTTDQTDHRAEADEHMAIAYEYAARVPSEERRADSEMAWASPHLLAAIHDGQRSLMDRAYEEQCEQTATLHVIRDLLAVMAEPKGDPCPCRCRRDVEPKPHVHFWKRQQNVTSRGYALDPIEVCECGTARRATDPEPDTVTVTLPRDVGVVWAHRRGKASPADGYVVMSGRTLAYLLRERGA